MRRREFLIGLGGATALPLATRAQQPSRLRRLGVLIPFDQNDPQTQQRITALAQSLQQLGWMEGHNLRTEYRFATEGVESVSHNVVELISLAPDAIMAASPQVLAALHQQTRSIPIVFVQVADPVAAGLVQSLARPGGNMTGFANFEWSLATKWLELLKEIAPGLVRVLVILTPNHVTNAGLLREIEELAPSMQLRVSSAQVRGAAEIDRAIPSFAVEPNSGLLVLPNPVTTGAARETIIALAAQHRLPAMYPFGFLARSGGLISYGVDDIADWRRAATYVDRIFKGEKPAELPIQGPTQFELVINLKTAKVLGLTIPPKLLALADEVVE